ncbi:MAG: hypothetical protein QXJ20_02910 [Candidatus Aenigmatarchaeota archaeon]
MKKPKEAKNNKLKWEIRLTELLTFLKSKVLDNLAQFLNVILFYVLLAINTYFFHYVIFEKKEVLFEAIAYFILSYLAFFIYYLLGKRIEK